MAKKTQAFALGARGEWPFLFYGLTTDQVELALSLPGTVQVSTADVRCTWDAAPEVALLLGLPEVTLPEPELPEAGYAAYLATGLKDRLRLYQKDVVAFLASRAYAICADPMRVGKSPPTLGAAELVGAKRVLIVAPHLAEPVWARHCANWVGSEALRLYGRAGTVARWYCRPCLGRGRTRVEDGPWQRCGVCKGKGFRPVKGTEDCEAAIREARYVVTGYDILIPQGKKSAAGVEGSREDLPGWAPMLSKVTFDVAILDESHRLRGYKETIGKRRQRTIRGRVQAVLKKIPRVWALTGTPVFGGVADLWSQIDLISAGTWGGKPWRHLERYCDFRKNEGAGWEAKGLTNEAELDRRLRRIMIKRRRVDLLPQMPKKTREVLEVEATKEARAEAAESVADRKTSAAKALTAAAMLKIPEVVENIIEEISEGTKVVVFAMLRATVDNFHNQLTEAIAHGLPEAKRLTLQTWKCHGGLSSDTRFKMTEAFGEWPGGGAFVSTIDSLQVAVSLAGAATVHFIELHWQPSALLQAEDRAYEPGTGGLHIVYWKLKDSIDEHVLDVVLPKMEAVDKLMNEEGAREFLTTFASGDDAKSMEELWAEMAKANLGDGEAS